MNQYFNHNENLKPDQRTIHYSFKGNSFTFKTDSGVFSKDHVDHATDILLNTIPELRGTLLDLGCGYGCIGIVLGKAYSLELTQSDVNPHAIELTSTNCQQNDVTSEIIQSNCYDNIDGKFDTIVINPPIHAGKAITYKMYEDSIHHLNHGGNLYIVTFKKHGAESTLTKLSSIFSKCDTLYKKKGIYVFCCENV